MKKLVATSILILAGTLTYAQQVLKPCGHIEATEEVYNMYPELRSHAEMQELLRNSVVYNPEGKSDSIQYVIPVVFHILHEYGTENISDSQIYDAMEVINREFNAEDPDSVFVIDQFQNLIADANIHFKLAAKDPFGNCTNGIEHIYTHETRIGDVYSKVNQWNRARYLNIWVVKVVGSAGAAAYALKPASTDGSGFWMDGIVTNHTYTGSTGTSNPNNESTVTHEIGHYLNLSHVWGNTNDPEVACGDDGVNDTPVTMGYSPGNCPSDTNNAKICDSMVVEDFNNYMDYSYCNYHYTPGQVEFMYNALEGIAGQRNLLWQDTNLVTTGVDTLSMPQTALTVPLCKPVADFWADDKLACVGSLVAFSDESWNAVIDSREWTFEGGSPATATSANVNVSWSTPGYKKVTLTVTNAAGSDTKTVNKYLYVAPDWADVAPGPQTLNIEGNSHYLFLVQNPEENHGKFTVTDNYGYNGSRCFKLTNYKDISNADLFTNEYFYNNRLGLSMDHLITPAFNLSNTTAITVKFKFAYATNATEEADITEKLKVYATRNCGASWSPTVISVDGSPVGSVVTGADLVTAGFAGNADFNPTSNNMWREGSFTYVANSSDVKTRFRFEFESSDYASNFFIDDIEVTGILGINDVTIADMELVVYPNPSAGEAINVSYNAQNEATQFILRDVQGKIIAQQVIDTTNAQVTTSLDNTENLPSACYFLEVRSGDHTITKKVVVL